MIYYVTTEMHSYTVTRMLKANPSMNETLRCLSYEQLFSQRAGPVGHYIFTDHDRLTRYELDCVSRFCARLREEVPTAKQLNDPARVKTRLELLDALQRADINSFHVIRTELGQRPPKYPVFIRCEDGFYGPETDLINSDEEYDQALNDLVSSGRTLRGRIAVGYAAEADEDGFYRKYGAFRIGGDILPHHIHIGQHWVVKRTVPELEWTVANDRRDGLSDRAVQQELEFVRDNPHRDILRRVFEIAKIDFGRVDYGIVNGRIEIYEINTNPTMPEFLRSDKRNSVREITKPQILDGFRDLDTPIASNKSLVRFDLVQPMAHRFRLPKQHRAQTRWQKIRRRPKRLLRALFRAIRK